MDAPLANSGLTAFLPRREAVVPLGDARLFVERVGSGRPLIILFGLGNAAWATRELADKLAWVREVDAIENRGVGRSTGPVDGLTIDSLADDAAAVVESLLHGQPVDVLGYSMGGYTALHFAARHPALTRSLTLLSTAAGGPGTEPVPASTIEAWAAADGLPQEENARATMTISFRQGWTDAHPDLYEAILARRAQVPEPSAVWEAQFAACEQHLHDGVNLAAIHAPALVIHGTGDRVVPFGNGERLAAGLPRARFVALEGAGHLSWMEDVDAVAGPVKAFLASLDAPGAR